MYTVTGHNERGALRLQKVKAKGHSKKDCDDLAPLIFL